jgi:hypothetical protein
MFKFLFINFMWFSVPRSKVSSPVGMGIRSVGEKIIIFCWQSHFAFLDCLQKVISI